MSDIFLSRTYPNNDRGECENLDYAIITINETIAKKIAGRLNIFEAAHKSDPDLIEMSFDEDHSTICFFSMGVFGAEDGNLPLEMGDLDKYEKFGWCGLSEGTPTPNEEKAEVVDGLMLKVSEYGFYWTAMPGGDMGVEVTTETFGREILSKVI